MEHFIHIVHIYFPLRPSNRLHSLHLQVVGLGTQKALEEMKDGRVKLTRRAWTREAPKYFHTPESPLINLSNFDADLTR